MKKIRASKYRDSPAVHFYLDDIEELYDLLTNNCERASIISNGYEYESIDELRNNSPKMISNIEIYGDTPYITLRIREWGFYNNVWLYLGDPTDKGTLLFSIIAEMLERRRFFLSRFFTMPIAFLSFIILSEPSFIKDTFVSVSSRLLVVLLPLIVVALCYFLRAGVFSCVYLEHKHDLQSFWTRKKDEILRTIISTIIGAFIALMLL